MESLGGEVSKLLNILFYTFLNSGYLTINMQDNHVYNFKLIFVDLRSLPSSFRVAVLNFQLFIKR